MNEVESHSEKNELKKGDSTNVEHLFKQYYARLCYFAYQIINNKDSAEDIVQDAFVKYWKCTCAFTNESSSKNYLYITVRNACLNMLRHEGITTKFFAAQDKSSVQEEKGLAHIIKAEALGQIHKAIETLPPGCGKILKLAYFEKLKNEEIAAHLGISINTVKTQKARALHLLRLKVNVDASL